MRGSSVGGCRGLLCIALCSVSPACGGQQALPSPGTGVEASPPPPASSTSAAIVTPPASSQGNRSADAIGDASVIGSLDPSLVTTVMVDGGEITLDSLQGVGTVGRGGGQDFSNGQSGPTIRTGAMNVTGPLSPELIQRIVRKSGPRIRLCYENGLRKNPKLEGTVTVLFGVDTSGAAKAVRDGGSTLGDADVVACVLRAFTNLSFPQPKEKDEVRVSYPILFASGRSTMGGSSSSPSSAAPKQQPASK